MEEKKTNYGCKFLAAQFHKGMNLEKGSMDLCSNSTLKHAIYF
jgi:hypothetical protein